MREVPVSPTTKTMLTKLEDMLEEDGSDWEKEAEAILAQEEKTLQPTTAVGEEKMKDEFLERGKKRKHLDRDILSAQERDRIYKIYRKNSLGYTLYSVVTELIEEEIFPSSLATKTFDHLDKSICACFKPAVGTKIGKWGGKVLNYRYFENVWTFTLGDAVFQTITEVGSSETITSKKCKLIAVDGRDMRKTKKRQRFEVAR